MGRAAVRGVTRNVARTQPPDPSGRELLISPRAMADRFVASPTHGFAFPYPRWSARPLPLAPVPHSGGPCLPPGFHILCVCLGDPPHGGDRIPSRGPLWDWTPYGAECPGLRQRGLVLGKTAISILEM